METDREVLMFLHDRFVHVYKESELTGYLHRLRAIIAETPEDRYTPSKVLNSMDALKKHLSQFRPKKPWWALQSPKKHA